MLRRERERKAAKEEMLRVFKGKEPLKSLSTIKVLRSSIPTVQGRVNLSNHNLTCIPAEVFQPDLLFQSAGGATLDRSDQDAAWWEYVDLSRLTIADNAITEIDQDIDKLESLVYFDAHNNQLDHIPSTLGQLKYLTVLNLSQNVITCLPDTLFQLPLAELFLQSNQLKQLPESIGQLDKLINLNVSDNQLEHLPESFGRLCLLQRLNLSKNKLTTLGSVEHLNQFKHLAELDLGFNKLKTLFQGSNPIQFPAMAHLDLKHNQLGDLVQDICMPHLKVLNLSFNSLKQVTKLIEGASCSLELLELRDNALEQVPPAILHLNQLRRLDISNNSIKKLPPELGLLNLNTLLFVGNPIRGLPTGGGTAALLKILRERIPVDSGASPVSASTNEDAKHILIQSEHKQHSKVLDLSAKGLKEIPEDVLTDSFLSSATQFIVHHNHLRTLSLSLLQMMQHQIQHIDLSHNILQEFPTCSFPHLKTLDLSCNRLTQFSLLDAPKLQELNLSFNKLSGLFPPDTLTCLALETLLVSNNLITAIHMESLANLSHLRILDMSNNDILHVPVQLGLCQNLTRLVLDGNSFKVPRRAILEKGTAAILAYLKDRVVL